MKKLALGLFALLLACSPARAQGVGPGVVACNKLYQASGPQTISVIVPANGRSITWCGWALNGGSSADTAQLSYGTGTNCGTGNTVITPMMNLSTNEPFIDHQNWGFITLPQNNDLCLVSTGAGFQVTVYYSVN